MGDTLKYQGYEAIIGYSAEDEVIAGRVVGIRDVISFHGESVREIVENFHSAVDDYLQGCRDRGEEPDRPFSGKVSLRMDPATHRAAALAAHRANASLNQWINDVIVASTRRRSDDREEATA